jgi:hypothetical protein
MRCGLPPIGRSTSNSTRQTLFVQAATSWAKPMDAAVLPGATPATHTKLIIFSLLTAVERRSLTPYCDGVQ